MDGVWETKRRNEIYLIQSWLADKNKFSGCYFCNKSEIFIRSVVWLRRAAALLHNKEPNSADNNELCPRVPYKLQVCETYKSAMVFVFRRENWEKNKQKISNKLEKMTEPKQPNHNHHQRQPSVGAAAAAISSKMNKKDSILESIYQSFGYKPPNKEELYQLICK